MRRAAILLPVLLALLLVAAGCGGGNDNGGGDQTKPADTTTTQTTAPSGGGGEVEIKMQNIAFAPQSATVKVGQAVKWSNEDTVAHNVTAQSGASFRSDNFGKGGDFTFTPKKAGTIQYVCTLHPGMTGTLTVTR